MTVLKQDSGADGNRLTEDAELEQLVQTTKAGRLGSGTSERGPRDLIRGALSWLFESQPSWFVHDSLFSPEITSLIFESPEDQAEGYQRASVIGCQLLVAIRLFAVLILRPDDGNLYEFHASMGAAARLSNLDLDTLQTTTPSRNNRELREGRGTKDEGRGVG